MKRSLWLRGVAGNVVGDLAAGRSRNQVNRVGTRGDS